MGIDAVTARFLLFCQKNGVDFSKTATLGRQSLYIDRRELDAIIAESEVSKSEAQISAVFADPTGYSEAYFRLLGATSIESVDASAYEGASIVHDMNKSIGPELKNKFSVVFDGGTLEHIFNFPVAIENCMKMLAVSGHFVSVAPANNFFGHGFYQFSSELFFRVFSKANGFEVGRVFLSAEKPFREWFEIDDPASTGERIFLRNQVSTFQLFYARKISATAGLHETPQQSDYAAVLWAGAKGNWTSDGNAQTLKKAETLRRLASFVPLSISRKLRAIRALSTGIRPPFKHKYLRKMRA